jgi:glutamate/tyrosine decarboxylase-like PLP-dependent enzyme
MLKIELFKGVLEKLYKYKSSADQRKVCNFKEVGEIEEIFDLNINSNSASIDEIDNFIDKYIDYSTNTHSRQFFNQFYTGGNLPSILGEIVTAFTNTSMYTYEVAPVATMIEKKMIEKMNSYIGFEDGDGIFTTGGSNANMIAMLSARNHKVKEAMCDGITESSRLTAFVSDQMHYSFQISANLLGIGIKNLRKVKSDSKGRLIPSELEKEIQKSQECGEIPFFVAGIAGTTVLGAFDNFVEISKIAKKHELWFHIDGALGGTFLLSDRKEKYYKGVELCDSFTWDAHKLMNIPFTCSVILTKNKGVLSSNISNLNKEYLYHKPNNEEFDLGIKSLQCGRKVDALKLFIAWKYYGDEKYRKMTNNLFEIAEYFAEKVKTYPELELLQDPESICVCYRVKHADMDNFNLKLRDKLLEIGKSMTNYTYINEEVYFRFVNVNMFCTKKDIDIFFDNFFEAYKRVKSDE